MYIQEFLEAIDNENIKCVENRFVNDGVTSFYLTEAVAFFGKEKLEYLIDNFSSVGLQTSLRNAIKIIPDAIEETKIYSSFKRPLKPHEPDFPTPTSVSQANMRDLETLLKPNKKQR